MTDLNETDSEDVKWWYVSMCRVLIVYLCWLTWYDHIRKFGSSRQVNENITKFQEINGRICHSTSYCKITKQLVNKWRRYSSFSWNIHELPAGLTRWNSFLMEYSWAPRWAHSIEQPDVTLYRPSEWLFSPDEVMVINIRQNAACDQRSILVSNHSDYESLQFSNYVPTTNLSASLAN